MEFWGYVEVFLVFWLVVLVSILGWTMIPSPNPVQESVVYGAVSSVQVTEPTDYNSYPEISSDKEVVESPENEESLRRSSGGNSRKNQKDDGVRFSKVPQNVIDKINSDGEARIIVSFGGDIDSVLGKLKNFDKQTEWSDGFAGYVDAEDLEVLDLLSDVFMIEEDLPLQTMTYEGYGLIDLEKVLSNDILTLDTVWPSLTTQYLTASGSESLTGAGQTVAMIDSGISWAHQEFNGKVINQWDFYENDNSPQDTWNHGTKMAGIIAAKGVNMDGMAPDADIVALRITNATGGAWTSLLYNSLDWVAKNATKYNITTIYIGLGYSQYDGTQAPCNGGGIYNKINELTNMNITVVAPAGHEGNITAIAAPACVANTISVGGIDDGGSNYPDTWNFTAESIQSNRRDGLLDILAPGADGATMTTNRSNYVGSTAGGTSVAAAYVAGASILLREYWDANGWNVRPEGLINGNIPNTIEYIMKQTGARVDDYRNPGVSYPRLDMFAAINYEENKPVVNLISPADGTSSSQGIINFEYNVTDQHEISSCSLLINNEVKQTDYSITKGTTQSFSYDVQNANNWKIECYDNSTIPNKGVSGTRNLLVELLDLPINGPGDLESRALIKIQESIELAASQGLHLTGKGQTVCIIDTGVEYNHDDLGNCTGTAFLTGTCQKTIAGYDFCGSSANCAGGPDTDPVDENDHGTGVAGIIAGNGTGYKGIAPDAKIVAVKITDASGNGWNSLLANAVRWCTDNATKYNITMISIGVAYDDPIFDYNETWWCGNTAIEDAVAANLTVFAPTGNHEDITEISYPACNEYTISTSAVADGSGITPADHIPNKTYDWGPDRFPGLTDLMAPGSNIYTLTDGETYGTKAGTSYASAHTVGSAMLLREYFQERYGYTLSPDEVRNIFSITGKPIWDGNTSAYYPRLDLLAAMRYETNAPVVTLIRENGSTVSEGSVILTYEAEDNEFEIANCTLYINGTKNETDTTVEEVVTEAFWIGLKEGTYEWQVKCYDNSTIPNEGVSETRIVNVRGEPVVTLNNPANGSTITSNSTTLDFTIEEDTTCRFEFDTTWQASSVKFFQSGSDEGTLKFKDINQETIEIPYIYNGTEIEIRQDTDENDGFFVEDDSCTGSYDTDDCSGTQILKVEANGSAYVLELRDIDEILNEIEIRNNNNGYLVQQAYTPEQITTITIQSVDIDVNVSEASRTVTFSNVNEYKYRTIKEENGQDIVLLSNTAVNVTSPIDGAYFELFYDDYDYEVRVNSSVLNSITSNVKFLEYDNDIKAGYTDYGTYIEYDTEKYEVYINPPISQIQHKDMLDNADNTYLMDNLAEGRHNISLDCDGYNIDYMFFVNTTVLSWTCNGIDKDNPAVCSGNGVCIAQDSCSCTGGWIGADCEIPPPDTTPPASITGLNSPSIGLTWIYWTWANPADADFSKNIIYIDGVNVLNTSNNYYNATGFAQNSSHTINVHTEDSNGNINNTDVADIQTTKYIDLVLTYALIYPDPIDFLQNYTANFTIKNIGNYDVTESFQLEIDACNPDYSNCNIGGLTISGIAAGETINGSHSQPLPLSRVYDETKAYIAIAVDGDSEVNEITKTNNLDLNNMTVINAGAPPASVTNLDYAGFGFDWLMWDWTNPADADFAENIIYIDGINVANTSNNYYNATGLAEGTSYTITVHTKDASGNVNDTDVNHTMNTDEWIDFIPPEPVENLTSPSHSTTWIYWEWVNPGDADFDKCLIWINGINAANTSNNYFNATGLTPSTPYTINIHPMDSSGNEDVTDVTDTVTTDSTCAESWAEQYGSCLTDDTKLKYYTDLNSCGTFDDLPGDNGTFVACNYCSYSVVNTTWSSWQDMESCQPDDTQEQNRSKTEYDENYAACYAVTTLPTDLWNSGNNNTYWEFQTASCDYCTPNLVNTTWTAWYNVSGCYVNNTIDQERNLTEYDDNYCGEAANATHFEYRTIGCTSPECYNDSDCDDGLYCNGNETCNAGICEEGIDIDCSPFDLSPFSVCDFLEEAGGANIFTLDVFPGFTSSCDEDANACTAGDTNATSSCDISTCGAECEIDDDCPDTDCDYLDGCVGEDWHDYDNASNSCLGDCLCETNSCGTPTITVQDPRCYTEPVCRTVCYSRRCYEVCD